MRLHPKVADYFGDTPEGRIVLCNAFAGVAIGLHSLRGVVKMLCMVDRDFRRDEACRLKKGKRPPGIEHVPLHLHEQRFPTTVAASSPCPVGYFGRSGLALSGVQLATVLPLNYLKDLLHSDDVERIEKASGWTLPLGTAPYIDPAGVKRLQGLGPQEFDLAASTSGGLPVALGRILLWFTTVDDIDQARRLAKTPDAFADRLRDVLGLVHLQKNQWLVQITFSGDAAELGEHYRPVFCDARGHRRFMVRSSLSDVDQPKEWGQTADLEMVEDGLPTFDGGCERVVPPLPLRDFAGKKLRFEVIGQLSAARGAHPGTDHDFSVYLANMNRRPRLPGRRLP